MNFPVKINYRPTTEMLLWCRENCTGLFYGSDQIGMDWIFMVEEDAVAFKLRWL